MRIENGNVRLETSEELSFGTDDNAKLYWDGNSLVGLTTVSGIMQGEQGPAGPEGPEGPQGPAGEGGIAAISGTVSGDLDFSPKGSNTAYGKNIFMGAYYNNSGYGYNGSIIMDYNANNATVASGTIGTGGHGIISPRAFPPGACPLGVLVSLNSSRQVVPTDMRNAPDRPAIGWALGADPVQTAYCNVVLFGGVYHSPALNSSGRGKVLYADPANPGYLTYVKPTTPGDGIQVIGYHVGSSNGVFINPSPDVEIVGAQLPSGWQFAASGDDLLIQKWSGSEWVTKTTISGA